jgi:NADPH:quinone reductase
MVRTFRAGEETTMRAITIQEFGDPDGMRLSDVPTPVAGDGQLLIRTTAIGVGGVDAVIRRGTLGPGFPVGMIPGSEIAGQVVAVGPGVDDGWVGRRVWAFTGTIGGYAEHAVAKLDDVIPLPDTLSDVDAVSLGSAGTVAHFALEHAHMTAGSRVLVRGAAGSIGIAAVELARQRGAGVVAVTASSASRGARLRELGATHVLDRSGRASNPSDDADAIDSFEVIIDVVGGPDVPRFIDLLAPNGRMVLVGAVAGFPPADFGAALLRSFQKSRSFATFSLDMIPIAERNAVRAAQFASGVLTPVVHEVLPLARAADAHRAMDVGGVFGRIVLTSND